VNKPTCSLSAPSVSAKAARNDPVNKVIMPVEQTASATKRRVRRAGFWDAAVKSANSGDYRLSSGLYFGLIDLYSQLGRGRPSSPPTP
jgi:hypothetical protein